MGRTVLDGADTGRDGKTMKNHKKTITMLLTAALLLFMSGCTSLTETKNRTPSEVDAPAESDGFGVYVKLERIEEMTARMGGDGRIQ